MKKMVAVTCVFALTACAEVDTSQISMGGVAGAIVGGVAGGMVGAKFGGGLGETLFTAAGVVIGAGVGYEAGNILYPSDQMAYDENARRALSYASNGTVNQWDNPETGNGGIFTPTNSYQTADGRSCRDYRATLALREEGRDTGVIAHQEGTACQQADGSWRSVKENFG